MSTSEGASIDVAMIAGSFCLPKNDPDEPLGDDSHFIVQVVQVIGLADGGIDASKYDRELMGKAAEFVTTRRYPLPSVDPRQLLRGAFSNPKSSGACTACNSRFVVIRGGKVVYRSPAQHAEFDCPYRMGRTAGGPELAEKLEVQVEAGDVIIAGAEGLFNHLFREDIDVMVKVSFEQNNQPNVLAESLAKAALEKSLDGSCKSPFGVAAQAAGLEYDRGKYDDFTVVAAYVQAYSKAKVHKFSTCCKWWGQNLEFRERKKFDYRKRFDYTSKLNRYKQNGRFMY